MSEKNVEVINLKAVKVRIRDLGNAVVGGSGALEEIGSYITFRIKDRTTTFRDVRGMFFAAYSVAYKKWRETWGYGTRVNLTLTGGMLGALTHKVNPKMREVKVFFMPGTSRRARGQRKKSDVQHAAKAYYLQQHRKFFGLAKKDVVKIQQIYEDAIKEAISGK